MIGLAAAGLVGIGAALRVPLWLGGHRWADLLRPPAQFRSSSTPHAKVVGLALVSVRLLSRVPGSPWRNTCLYRSVAHCLALRHYGIPAIVRLGVRADEATGSILAHAWVVPDPSDEPAPPDAMLPFPVRA